MKGLEKQGYVTWPCNPNCLKQSSFWVAALHSGNWLIFSFTLLNYLNCSLPKTAIMEQFMFQGQIVTYATSITLEVVKIYKPQVVTIFKPKLLSTSNLILYLKCNLKECDFHENSIFNFFVGIVNVRINVLSNFSEQFFYNSIQLQHKL